MFDQRLKLLCRSLVMITSVLASVLWFVVPVNAAPEAELWPMWQAHDPASTVTMDHAMWDDLLTRYRRGGGQHGGIARFDYGAAKRDDARPLLGAYLTNLAGQDPRHLNRAAQRAYWVNLYNALTVAVVLDHFPVKSIRDIGISPGLFSIGPWGKKLITIAGADVSLNDVEHRILRPIWRDARLHYVLNCASLGCPDLPEKAMTAGNGNEMLDRAARRFINHPRGALVDRRGRLQVSSIYHWFRDDFDGSDMGVIRHLKMFALPDLAGQMATVTEIDDHAYDWRLNQP